MLNFASAILATCEIWITLKKIWPPFYPFRVCISQNSTLSQRLKRSILSKFYVSTTVWTWRWWIGQLALFFIFRYRFQIIYFYIYTDFLKLATNVAAISICFTQEPLPVSLKLHSQVKSQTRNGNVAPFSSLNAIASIQRRLCPSRILNFDNPNGSSTLIHAMNWKLLRGPR